MTRREFISLLGGAAASVSTPLPLSAQEAGRIYRIGFVSAAPREEAWYTAFFEELRGLGFVEGQNLTVISGGFGVRNELLGEVAAALVRAAPNAIVAAGPIAARAAQAATKTTRRERRHGRRWLGAVNAASWRQYDRRELARAGARRQAAGPHHGGGAGHSPDRRTLRSPRLHSPTPAEFERGGARA